MTSNNAVFPARVGVIRHPFIAYDVETAKEIKTGSTSTNSDAGSDHQQPIPILISSHLSISDFL